MKTRQLSSTTRFDEYRDRYSTIRMERHEGILQLRFHTGGGPLQWTLATHNEWADAFGDIGRDQENEVVIMTGTGDSFSGPQASNNPNHWSDVREWDHVMRIGLRMTANLLDVEALVIACINGPTLRHAEIPLLSDIVLASPDTTFQDTAHLTNQRTPGDGVNLIMPLLMGLNRGRYFLLTGQVLTVQEALTMGLVNEIVERDRLIERALELARELRKQNLYARRYTRWLLMEPIKDLMRRSLGHGLALEGLAALDLARPASE